MARQDKVDASGVFFPLASTYAMVALPASVHALTTGRSMLPGFATPLCHAHELLFGYTLAVATGFLLNRVPAWWVAGLLIAWLGGRVAFLAAPYSALADVTNIAFAVGFAAAGASRFFPAAKKWRNQVFGLNIIVLGSAAVVAQVMVSDASISLIYLATYEAVLMFALLMLLMGGRFIAPAAAGHIEKRGGILDARVQPRLEGALIVLLIGAAVAFLFPGADYLSGPLLFACGVVASVRLLRWRLWECRDRPDLIALGVGYLWLAIGLMLVGASLAVTGSIKVALHAITIGAIGTLTLAVMSRTWMQRSGVDPSQSKVFILMPALIAGAAILRLGSGIAGTDSAPAMQMLAAAAWAAAFVIIIAGVFLKYPGKKLLA